ncbi:MAG: ABC transporter substrate-binding protein [Saccharofermentanales bacterium]
MKRERKLPVFFAMIIITMTILMLSSCNTGTSPVSSGSGSAESIISKSTSKSTGKVKITVVLDWVVNTNHIGLYVAQEKGYFKQENLEVKIVQAPEMNFVEMVGADTAQFGICGQEQLTQARSTGTVPVVAIGTILQHNTSGFASPADRNIKTPKDFEGKIYSGWGTPLEEKFIETLMKKSGGDFKKVTMRMMGATDFFASMETEADFAWIYYGWDGVGATVRKYPINFISLQDVDPKLDFYSPLFISNEKTIKENPEVVRSFMKAVSKGYEYTVNNVEESCDLLLKSTPETDREHAIKSVKWLSGYFLDENQKFGTMKETLWLNFSQWMYDNKLIDKPLDVSDSYTNIYLPK